MNDLRKGHEEPFIIKNQVFILGNPVIPVDTLEQLVNHLDQLGANQPIVIINPEAQVIPNFDSALSNLIQNNRSKQLMNVTHDDKYAFKDFTDEQLRSLVDSAVATNPNIDKAAYLEIYQGLRLRAQYLFYLEQLCRERDSIWAYHLANLESNEGVERYGELQSRLIPEAQSYYQYVCNRLQELESSIEKTVPNTQPVAASIPVNTNNTSITQLETRAANEELCAANVEPNVNNTYITPVRAANVPIWGPWLTNEYLVMPLSAARNTLQSPGLQGLVAQQHDVEYEGVIYKAVEPEYLIALGIPVFPDGVPVVYTDLGKFRRVGNSSQPLNNLDYWYPTPRRVW